MSAAIGRGKHLFPYRTQKLSPFTASCVLDYVRESALLLTLIFLGMGMEPKVRAEKDIQKLAAIIREFTRYKLQEKYPRILEWTENYYTDAQHFYEKGDYFSAFGAANYAFGIMDGILILEGKK